MYIFVLLARYVPDVAMKSIS